MPHSDLVLGIVSVVSIATGIFIGQSFQPKSHPVVNFEDLTSDEEEDDLEIDSLPLNSTSGEVRMVMIIRTDLGMTKGKVAAQCCHAAVSCYRKIASPNLASFNIDLLNRWERGGQAKITLKCPSEEALYLLRNQAVEKKINCAIIHDAGRTQIAPNSATVLGIGPAPKVVIDQITSSLKLY